MVRGKVEMKRIDNRASRQVSFFKRRNGLLKKASELSLLCDAEVAVIVFSQNGRLYEFSSSNMQQTIGRYLEHTKEERSLVGTGTETQIQHLKCEAASLTNKIELLQNSQRKILGHNVESYTEEELHQIDIQLERSLRIIRDRKCQLFNEEVEKLCSREDYLSQEKAKLCEKCGLKESSSMDKKKEIGVCSKSTLGAEVVTELSIGPPAPPSNNIL